MMKKVDQEAKIEAYWATNRTRINNKFRMSNTTKDLRVLKILKKVKSWNLKHLIHSHYNKSYFNNRISFNYRIKLLN